MTVNWVLKKISFFLVGLGAFMTWQSLSAQIAIPVTTWQGSLPEVKQARPQYLAEVIDPVFKTHLRRMTNDGDRGYYALRPVFNCDSTKYILQSGTIRNVSDGSSFGVANEMVGDVSFGNPMWSKVNPQILYGTIGLKLVALNIQTRQLNVIRDMQKQDGFTSNDGTIYMDNLQSISGNDQYVVLSDVTRGGNKVVVVDIQTGGRHAMINDVYAPGTPFKVFQNVGDTNKRMIVGISPRGNYIVLGGVRGQHLFDHKLNYIRLLDRHGHHDFGIDSEGNEVLVSVCPAKYEILRTGEVIDLLGPKTFACGHVNASANYQQPGWAYLSLHSDSNDVGKNAVPQQHELVAVRLDRKGTTVRRLVHPHTTGIDNERSAFAVPNADGTKLMFNSTWGDSGKTESYLLDLTKYSPKLTSPKPPPASRH